MGVREEAVPRPQAKQLLSREPWRSRAVLAPCFLARPACGHAAMETVSRLPQAPAPRCSELRGNSTAPSAKHAPAHPSSGSWHFPGPGSCFFFCSPHLPTAPQCPGIPTSRAEPTPCPEGRRQEVPTPALHSGSGQPPTDQHWAILCPSSPLRLPLRSCCVV